MIGRILSGDITDPKNPCDIIIGMNSELQDVRGIGMKFVRNLIPLNALQLGSVISFDFDEKRKLHMIICHDLGRGGWAKADMHVRFGLDYLHHLNEECRKHSIVQIGTGRVGMRDGADHVAIRSAIATSFLLMDLYVYDLPGAEAVMADVQLTKPLKAWNPIEGDIPLRMSA